METLKWKHLKRFNEEFGRDEVVFTGQRNPRTCDNCFYFSR